jgi:ABC-type amino acid transport substrate-binding protein
MASAIFILSANQIKSMQKLVALSLALSAMFSLAAQDSTLTVGIRQSLPFINVHPGEQPSGISMDFWELVDNDVPARIQFKKYQSLESLTNALRNREVDLSINPLTVTDQRMQYLDFSQPYYISGTALVRKKNNAWFRFLANVFSWRFLSAAAILLGVIFLFGVLIWLFERQKNQDQFNRGAKGLADGFWWSAVTMTTVGYGDKAPQTRGGRVIGFIWMFAAILMISGLTAGIASALTVTTLENNINSVEDLRRFKTGTIKGSSSDDYLELFAVEAQKFNSVEAGLEAVDAGDLDLFVYDRPILEYHLKQQNLSDLYLVEKNLKTDYYSFSYPKGSYLRDTLDPLIVRALKSQSWNQRLNAK